MVGLGTKLAHKMGIDPWTDLVASVGKVTDVAIPYPGRLISFSSNKNKCEEP